MHPHMFAYEQSEKLLSSLPEKLDSLNSLEDLDTLIEQVEEQEAAVRQFPANCRLQCILHIITTRQELNI